MFEGLYSWRLKRRQRALALAWCGDRVLADRLLAESRTARPGSVESYRRMADCWLRTLAASGNSSPEWNARLLYDPEAPHDALSCRVRRLISRMPVAQRMTLSLVDVARLSYRETAAVMNIGLFDVQYHIVTARRQLLEEIHPDSAPTPHLHTADTAESF